MKRDGINEKNERERFFICVQNKKKKQRETLILNVEKKKKENLIEARVKLSFIIRIACIVGECHLMCGRCTDYKENNTIRQCIFHYSRTPSTLKTLG